MPNGQAEFDVFWLQTTSVIVLLTTVVLFPEPGLTVMPRAPLLPVALVLDTPWMRFPDTVTLVTTLPRKMPATEPEPPPEAVEVMLVIVLFATEPPAMFALR